MDGSLNMETGKIPWKCKSLGTFYEQAWLQVHYINYNILHIQSFFLLLFEPPSNTPKYMCPCSSTLMTHNSNTNFIAHLKICQKLLA